MAEAQLAPSVDGQELRQQDVALLGQLSGLGPDYVLAELLRITPFDGTNTTKGILPYGTHGGTAGTVIPTGSANASVLVQPFRALVGSRTAAGTNAVANWRDIRSSLFTGSATSLTLAVGFAPNSSGNPRWDVVYAVVSVDKATNPIAYRVKSPIDQSISNPTLNQVLTQPITVAVQAGTPASTPTVPSIPADAAGVYNIPLAAVRIPNGFNSVTTISPKDIRDISPVVQLAGAMGAHTTRPANGNNDGSGAYATNFPWAAGTFGSRPGPWLPPGMTGAHTLFVAFDATNASTPSFANGAIVDNAIDWRGRIFTVFVTGGPSATLFAMDPATGTPQRVPSWNAGSNGTAKDWQQANSIVADGNLVSGKSTVYFGTPTTLTALGAGSTLGLYVEPSDGTLRAAFTGTPAARVWFTIFASAQVPNV